MGRERAPNSHHLTPNEASRWVWDISELLVKGCPWISPNNSCCCHTISSSPQTDHKAPLPKTTPTQPTGHGEVKLVPTESLHPYCSSIFCTARFSALYPKEKCSQLLRVWSTRRPALSYASAMTTPKPVGLANQYLIWLKALSTNGTHIQHCLDDQEPETR